MHARTFFHTNSSSFLAAARGRKFRIGLSRSKIITHLCLGTFLSGLVDEEKQNLPALEEKNGHIA
jgi:hypothetical protein